MIFPGFSTGFLRCSVRSLDSAWLRTQAPLGPMYCLASCSDLRSTPVTLQWMLDVESFPEYTQPSPQPTVHRGFTSKPSMKTAPLWVVPPESLPAAPALDSALCFLLFVKTTTHCLKVSSCVHLGNCPQVEALGEYGA